MSASSPDEASKMLTASKALLSHVVQPSGAGAKMPSVKLANGLLMPQLGLGTYELRAEQCVASVTNALQMGYRHIDTAGGYKNEDLVAQGIAESGVPRELVWITSKLPPTKHGAGAYEECLATIERLKTSYVDLYLLHWPGVAKKALNDPTIKEERKASWLALERLYKEGKCKAIGVSNFLPMHLADFDSDWCTVKPMVNQFELHPLCKQMDIVEDCVKRNIAVEAYASLARGNPKLLQSDVVKKIVAAHSDKGATPSQVCLAWAIQRGIVVIPKSASPERLKENFAACDLKLSDEELAALDAMEEAQETEGGGSLRTCWNPHTIEV
jgi:diketogulonate reductase-like aldo/keto reductase